MESPRLPVTIVGAGISGVACARVLTAAGIPVELVDRGRRAGGRMASRRHEGRPADIGASYFTVSDPANPDHVPTFRVALHHDGTAAELDRLAGDVEQIVTEMVTVFGEFPSFETGRYTFIADYLPTASGDAMEHRNSTVLSSSGAVRARHGRLLGSVSHEFFHVWNVERIRPRSLEPFDFEDVNPSGELWLAEGFTNYYGALILQRVGLADPPGDDAHHLTQALGKRRRRLLLLLIAHVGYHPFARDLPPVRLGHRQRQLARQEIVACIPGGDLDDIAAASEMIDRFPENDLHRHLSRSDCSRRCASSRRVKTSGDV